MEIEENKRAIKLKDANNTIIFIDKDADVEKSVKKYMDNLKNFKYYNSVPDKEIAKNS